MNLVDLETFVKVAEAGSVTQAARELDLPKSTVSRRVARLEDAVGVDLVQRAGRSISLTEEGHSLHRRCAHALREIVEAGRALSDAGGEARGLLRISAPHDLGGSRAFASLLTEFRGRYPDVQFELELTARMVDLVEEGFDAALRVHVRPLPDTSQLKVKRLGSLSSRIYASPRYLARRPAPQSPDDLLQHPCIALSHSEMRVRWVLRAGEEERAMEIEPALLVSDYSAALTLVLAGAGIAALPNFIAMPYLRDEELEEVLAGWNLAEGTLSLVWPVGRHMPPKLRVFIDFVQARASAGLFFAEPRA